MFLVALTLFSVVLWVYQVASTWRPVLPLTVSAAYDCPVMSELFLFDILSPFPCSYFLFVLLYIYFFIYDLFFIYGITGGQLHSQYVYSPSCSMDLLNYILITHSSCVSEMTIASVVVVSLDHRKRRYEIVLLLHKYCS